MHGCRLCRPLTCLSSQKPSKTAFRESEEPHGGKPVKPDEIVENLEERPLCPLTDDNNNKVAASQENQDLARKMSLPELVSPLRINPWQPAEFFFGQTPGNLRERRNSRNVEYFPMNNPNFSSYVSHKSRNRTFVIESQPALAG